MNDRARPRSFAVLAGGYVNRRAFLASVAAAFAFDPERALWRPGAKLISIPKPVRPVWSPTGSPTGTVWILATYDGLEASYGNPL